MSISRFNAVEKASNRKAVEAITPNQKVSEYYGENAVSYTHLTLPTKLEV